MSTGIIDSLLPAIDSILGVRDQVGAVIQPVYFVTRTWYSDEARTTAALEAGGYAKDVEVQMLPSPGLKNYAHDVRLREGGAVKAGDIVLTNVSKNSFTETDLDGTSSAINVQKLIRVGGKFYQTINVVEKYVTWDVQIRALSDHTRYP